MSHCFLHGIFSSMMVVDKSHLVDYLTYFLGFVLCSSISSSNYHMILVSLGSLSYVQSSCLLLMKICHIKTMWLPFSDYHILWTALKIMKEQS